MKRLLWFIVSASSVLCTTEAFSGFNSPGLLDIQGNAASTGSSTFTRNPIDVESLFGGSIIDPRTRQWTLGVGTDSVSSNTYQVGGNTVNTGIGTAGTGTQRVAVSSDSAINDVRPVGVATGTLTAVCTTPNSCAAGSTVSLAVPEGQSAWDVYLGGTFSAASQVTFEGTTDPNGVVDWFYLNGRRNTDATTNDTTTLLDATPMGGTPPMGSNPSNWRGNTAAIKFLRVRCSIYTAADAISVRINTGVGTGAVFINAALPPMADKSGTGTITALNGVVKASTNGTSTVVFSVTGTWVGTLFFQGINQDGTTAYLYANSVAFGTDFDVQSTTVNGTYIVAVGGFSNVQLIAGAYTSGTVLVGWTSGVGTKTLKVFQPNAASFNATVVGSGTAGTPSSGVVSVQGIASGTVLPTNTSQVGGNSVNTGAGATSTGTQRTASNTYDGSGNAIGSNQSNLYVAQGSSHAVMSTATTTTHKAGAGMLMKICANTLVNAATIQCFDNTAASGTSFGTNTMNFVTALNTAQLWSPTCENIDGATFATGLTCITSGTGNWTVYWK